MPESLQKNSEFDEIRPYYDEEVKEVVQNLLLNPSFQKVVQYIFPDWESGKVETLLADVASIKRFQKQLMYPVAERILNSTTSGLTYSGFEQLDRQQAYLFVSNHRDIILDSALLNLILFKSGMDTCEVAIGSNLLIEPWIKDLVRLNKNFIVHRDVPSKKLYEYSLRLSSYIRQTIVDRGSSVWIAQKEGRTKDGNDTTQAGLLKMLSISGQTDLISNFKSLSIVPLAISYEYEPCDYLKANELYQKAINGHYKKSPEDDLKSMSVGLTSYKGRVHFALGKLMNEKIDQLDQTKNKNELIKSLVGLIDQEVYELYHLWPSNYIAHDLLNNSELYKAYYAQNEKADFLKHIEKAIQKVDAPAEEIKQILLTMYATPVENKMRNT